MKDPYPFQALLQAHQAGAEEAHRALAEAQVELDDLTALRGALLATWERIGRSAKEEREAIEGVLAENGGCASRLQLFEERAMGLQDDERSTIEHLREIERRMGETRTTVEEKRRVLNECLVQKRVLEQHRERWLKTLTLQGERREEWDQEAFTTRPRAGDDGNGHDR